MNTTIRRSRVLIVVATAALVSTFAAYVLLLQQQATTVGQGAVSVLTALQGAPTWLLIVLAATLTSLLSSLALQPGRLRRSVLLSTAVILVVVGVVGAFSIGLGLLIAGVLAGTAAGVADPPAHPVEHAR